MTSKTPSGEKELAAGDSTHGSPHNQSHYLPIAEHRDREIEHRDRDIRHGDALPNMLPHTKSGEASYYIGDIYEPLESKPWHDMMDL
jgi:hypothetical protein